MTSRRRQRRARPGAVSRVRRPVRRARTGHGSRTGRSRRRPGPVPAGRPSAAQLDDSPPRRSSGPAGTEGARRCAALSWWRWAEPLPPLPPDHCPTSCSSPRTTSSTPRRRPTTDRVRPPTGPSGGSHCAQSTSAAPDRIELAQPATLVQPTQLVQPADLFGAVQPDAVGRFHAGQPVRGAAHADRAAESHQARNPSPPGSGGKTKQAKKPLPTQANSHASKPRG